MSTQDLNVELIPAFQDNYIYLLRTPGSDDVGIVDAGDAAPAIAERRQIAEQHEAAGIGPIPAEDTGLAPKPQRRRHLWRTRGDRLSKTGRPFGPNGDADTLVPPGGLTDRAAELSQFLGEALAAAILGRKRGQPARGGQDAQGMGQRIAALQHARRGQDGDRIARSIRQIFEPPGAGHQGRKLNCVRPDRCQRRIGETIDRVGNRYSPAVA
jgi:hypothetical protein